VSAYTLSVFSPLNTLGGILNSIVQSLADVDNLLALLAIVPDIQDSEEAGPLPIRTNRFSKDTRPTAGLSVQFEGL
jgi:ABC-type transport system involved in Fe-S cluster assembly fused permease/ATPase subunit